MNESWLSPQPQEPNGQPAPPIGGRHWLLVGGIVVAGVIVALLVWWVFMALMPKQQQEVVVPDTSKPTLLTSTVTGGYDHIWDMIFLPTKEMIFDERSGTIHIMLTDGKVRDLHKIQDVSAVGEGGLLGLEVDPKFSENRYMYACFNSVKDGEAKRDVRVARFKVASDLTKLEERTDIVTGIPTTVGGRHSGCRVKFGPDGYLYVGTGDAALGGVAADHRSLGGKILRIDRDGDPAQGNLGGDFDPRIYSWGHRNVQGLAFFPTAEHKSVGVSVEHGSSEDDEINVLDKGNFGWAHPAGEYTEVGVPMTDKVKFPDAISAIWSSGTPTQAPSGATFLVGKQWKYWNGALVMAVLKDKHLKVLTIDSANKVTTTENIFVNQFGRLRTAVQGPDGNLYMATDNGLADQIIRVTPQ